MTNYIRNFTFLEDYLDVESVTEFSPWASLLGCSSIDTDTLISINQSGTASVPSGKESLYADVVAWLRLNGLISETLLLTDLFAGCTPNAVYGTADVSAVVSLRGSEIIRAVIECALYSSSYYSSDGEIIDPTRMFLCVLEGPVHFGGFSNTGMQVVSGSSYYNADMTKGVMKTLTIDAPGSTPDVSMGQTCYEIWVGEGGGTVSLNFSDGHTITSQFMQGGFNAKPYSQQGDALNGKNSPVTFKYYVFTGTGDNGFSVGYWMNIKVRWHYDNTTNSVTAGDELIPQVGAELNVRIGDIYTGGRLTGIDVHISDVNVKTFHATVPWDHDGWTRTYPPDVHFNASYIVGEFYQYLMPSGDKTIDNVTVHANGTASGTYGTHINPFPVTVTGYVEGWSRNIVYKASIDPIGSQLYYDVPKHNIARTSVPVTVAYNVTNPGSPLVGEATASGSYDVPPRYIEVEGQQVFNSEHWSRNEENRLTRMIQCVKDQDQVSPYEALSDVTVQQLNRYFGTVIPKTDPYFDMLIDNTIITMCIGEIDYMVNMLTSDPGVVEDIYGLHYFDNFDAVAGNRVDIGPCMFVYEDGVYYDVREHSFEWGYASGTEFIITQDHHLQADHFAIGGLCLSDAYDHANPLEVDVTDQVTVRNIYDSYLVRYIDDKGLVKWRPATQEIDVEEQGGLCVITNQTNGVVTIQCIPERSTIETFIQRLLEARVDCETQLLMYVTINGVMSSTEWLSEAGKFLADRLNDVYKTTQSLLSSISDIAPVSVSQKRSLMAGSAYNSIPATRVGQMLDAAASAGAKTANAALGVISGLGGDYSINKIQSPGSRQIVNYLTDISEYKGYQARCTRIDDRPQSADHYLTTFFERSSAAILSAVGNPNDGVESEVCDLGVGLSALYPALMLTNITRGGLFPDDVLPNPLLIPLASSYVIISNGSGPRNYDVGWYAATLGGSDADIVQDIMCSLNEMKTMVELIGYNPLEPDKSVKFTFGDPHSLTYQGSADLVDTMSVVVGAATGAATGALLLSVVPGVGTAVGAVAGGIIGAGLAMVSNIEQSEATKANEEYSLAKLEGITFKLQSGTQFTENKDVIARTILDLMLAAVSHGAVYPYGNDHQLEPRLLGCLTPGKPCFRYVQVADKQDWSPLILSGFALLSIGSLKTCIKAWGNPTRDPALLPAVLLSNGARASVKTVDAAYSTIAAKQDDTYAAQKDILDAIEDIETGTFTDEAGTVTLRDVYDMNNVKYSEMVSLMEKMSQQLKADTADSFSTY